ncbi:hypothetical protein NUW54_g11911 [Trametes sanguinea]|uniref:Uncharacterized protein n=1 Tax=Trametes sanguinea TaxID=158606 RepID=A0ACC1N5E9_9APHY|nr:hypothetical protein NUW54_g11911 [Trametes sanguinea]
MADRTPVEMAEELLQLVKSLDDTTGSTIGDQEAYDAKKRVQYLSNLITRRVAGPLEYTVLLAGMGHLIPWHSPVLTDLHPESCHESAALRFVTEYGVADCIGDGIKALPDISKELKVNARYLSAAMNCMLMHGYFEEVKDSSDSRAFKNNAMSDVLRENHPQSLKAAIGFICDDGFKAAAYLAEAAREDGQPAAKGAPTALNLAFGFQGPAFQHWANADQAWRGKRMGQAMKQLHQMANANVVTDFDWRALQSPLVDLGGGIGTLEMALTKAYPQSPLNFIIVDIAETVKNALAVR